MKRVFNTFTKSWRQRLPCHLYRIAEAKKNSKDNGGAKKVVRRGRIRSLSPPLDLLFRLEFNTEDFQGGHRRKKLVRDIICHPEGNLLRSQNCLFVACQNVPVQREDSDYEGEIEFDFQAYLRDDQGRVFASSILPGCINLRFQQSGSSSQHENCASQLEVAIDMKQRYVGHCNIGKDIKQASFLGHQGEFVASGSDDGRWFIWEKTTGRLIKMLAGDDTAVNCVQCHPFDCAVVTSGTDNIIKMWTPHAGVPSMVAGGTTGPMTPDILSVLETNQRKLRRHREAELALGILRRFTTYEIEDAEGTFHPCQCNQM